MSRSIVRLTFLLLTLGIVLWTMPGLAEEPPDPPAPRATHMADLAWLAGSWRGSFFDQGPMEEAWQAPMGNAMVGTFRALKGETTFLYEMLLIEQTEKGIDLHLRHFDAGLAAWASEAEKHGVYPLVSHAEGKAVFEDPKAPYPQRMVYEKTGADELEIRLEGKHPNGQPHTVTFRFQRHRDG